MLNVMARELKTNLETKRAELIPNIYNVYDIIWVKYILAHILDPEFDQIPFLFYLNLDFFLF